MSRAALTRSGRSGAGPQLAVLHLQRDLAQPALERGIDAAHLQPDLRHHGFALADLRAAHALAAQRGEPRARGFLGAEHAEREGPALRAFLLHDEVLGDAERLPLGGLAD